MTYDIKSVSRNFQIGDKLVHSELIIAGHINDTFKISCEVNGQTEDYILQRINHVVFKNPPAVMSNIQKVINYFENHVDEDDSCIVLPELVPAVDGSAFYHHGDGCYWRMYKLFEGASRKVAETEEQAGLAASAFGAFQKGLAGLDSSGLKETISDFHNTLKRFDNFVKACEEDSFNRAVFVKEEISFAMDRRDICDVPSRLQGEGVLPQRVVHNDTKLNNILFGKDGQMCVIDLDTVMPGLVLFDFGDLLRTMTCGEKEDSADLSNVLMRMSFFESIVKGYLSTAGVFLTQCEKDYLAFSGKLITFETGLRFLTDYLQGDVYFKTDWMDHNLDRCRNQFKLVCSMEEQEEAMKAFVSSL